MYTNTHRGNSKKSKNLEHLLFVEKYYKSPKKCKRCNMTITFEKRWNAFCSSSCSASFNNKLKPKRRKKEFKKCLWCGNPVRNKYCNNTCRHLHSWDKWKKIYIINNEFLGNIFHAHTSSSHYRKAKRFLSETRGYKCEICGIYKWNGNIITLILDHIDGKSSNWNIPNLRLICPNCDSQLPTFKGRNRGNSSRKFNVTLIKNPHM